MAKLSIEQAHTLPLDEVRKRLSGLADRLGEKYGIESRWVSDREADIKRTGVHGKIRCTDERVTVSLDISFALLPLKNKIEERIRRELAESLAAG
jgi:putative polyhydroxyalkanoate system protein